MTRMPRTPCGWLTCGVVALIVNLAAAGASVAAVHSPLALTTQGADVSSSISSRPRKLLQEANTTSRLPISNTTDTSTTSSGSNNGPCADSPQQGQASSVDNTPASQAGSLPGAAAAGKVLPGIGDPPVHINTLLVALPVLGMVGFLGAMLLCLHKWLQRAYPGGGAARTGDFWGYTFTPTGFPFVRAVTLVQVESELTQQSSSTGSNADIAHHLSSNGLRVRSLPDVVLMWQQHLQGASTTVRTSASFPTAAHIQRQQGPSNSFGVARSSSSSSSRLERSSLPRGAIQRQPSNQLQQGDTATSARQQRLAAAAAVGEQVFALLAPDVADLRQNYLSVCDGLTAFDQISPERGPRRADRVADRQRLVAAKHQLQNQLQEVQLQVQGRALVTWQDVEVCWGIWQALDDAGASNPVIAARQRRFPGLAPWLIAELPTWVHTESESAPAPAPEPAAAAGEGGADTADSAPAATTSSSSHAAPDAALEIVSTPANLQLDSSTLPGSTAAPSKVLTPSSRAQQAVQPTGHQVAWAVQGSGLEDDDTEDSSCCAVCLDPLEPGDLLQRLPPCGHTFHAPCLASWLANSATCPVCRTVVLPRAMT